MSLSRTTAFEPAGAAPFRSRRAFGSQIWIARLATVWGFAGAVLVQTAAFGLVARIALQLDSAALPGLAVSVVGLALGALAMMGSKSLIAQPRLAG